MSPWPRDRVSTALFSSLVLSNETRRGNVRSGVIVYVIHDERCSFDHPFGDAIEVLIRREDAERFLSDVRKDEPELARHLRIVERELDAGSFNQRCRRRRRPSPGLRPAWGPGVSRRRTTGLAARRKAAPASDRSSR